MLYFNRWAGLQPGTSSAVISGTRTIALTGERKIAFKGKVHAVNSGTIMQ